MTHTLHSLCHQVNKILRREEAHFREFGQRKVNHAEERADEVIKRLGFRLEISEEKQEEHDRRDMFCRYLDDLLQSVPVESTALFGAKRTIPLQVDHAYLAKQNIPRPQLAIQDENYYLVPEDFSGAIK